MVNWRSGKVFALKAVGLWFESRCRKSFDFLDFFFSLNLKLYNYKLFISFFFELIFLIMKTSENLKVKIHW